MRLSVDEFMRRLFIAHRRRDFIAFARQTVATGDADCAMALGFKQMQPAPSALRANGSRRSPARA